MENDIQWCWSKFADLSSADIYEILRVRQEVFVVEQNCRYQDADGSDQDAWHLYAWISVDGHRQIGAYLRVLKPGVRYPEASIGRVLTTQAARGRGLGKQLIAKGIEHARQAMDNCPIRISAQAYLQKFYTDFGFVVEGAPYDEEGIEHIQMLLH